MKCRHTIGVMVDPFTSNESRISFSQDIGRIDESDWSNYLVRFSYCPVCGQKLDWNHIDGFRSASKPRNIQWFAQSHASTDHIV